MQCANGNHIRPEERTSTPPVTLIWHIGQFSNWMLDTRLSDQLHLRRKKSGPEGGKPPNPGITNDGLRGLIVGPRPLGRAIAGENFLQ